jgi:hypothetical protein
MIFLKILQMSRIKKEKPNAYPESSDPFEHRNS